MTQRGFGVQDAVGAFHDRAFESGRLQRDVFGEETRERDAACAVGILPRRRERLLGEQTAACRSTEQPQIRRRARQHRLARPDDDRDLYCMGEGPPILVGGGGSGDDVCAGDLAQDTFRRALCACDSMTNNAPVAVDSFDSREGPYAPGQGGGDVGINGKLEQRLNDAGVYHYWQIADLDAENTEALDRTLNLKGRITRDGWVAAAKKLSEAEAA